MLATLEFTRFLWPYKTTSQSWNLFVARPSMCIYPHNPLQTSIPQNLQEKHARMCKYSHPPKSDVCDDDDPWCTDGDITSIHITNFATSRQAKFLSLRLKHLPVQLAVAKRSLLSQPQYGRWVRNDPINNDSTGFHTAIMGTNGHEFKNISVYSISNVITHKVLDRCM